jgi:AcrR family transcriptional regulator
MRADGRRNRQRVLEAAAALLAERGLKVQIEEIAQRAGVGVGTVCRNFSTKEALIDTVLAGMCEEMLEQARVAQADPDAGHAFTSFVANVADFQARHRVLAEEMATTVDMPTGAVKIKRALRHAVEDLVARAQDAGALRADIGPADLAMLFAGIGHAAALAGVDSVLRQRYLTVVLDGLRPIHPTPLPGIPLGFEELDRLRARGRRTAARVGGHRGDALEGPT